MKKIYTFAFLFLGIASVVFTVFYFSKSKLPVEDSKTLSDIVEYHKVDKKKKTNDTRALFSEERLRHEFNMQKNPVTGLVPRELKEAELQQAQRFASNPQPQSEAVNYDYASRGPSNLGGRTRTIVIDKTDATGNTMLAGGVSSGVFRTTNGGADWTKVSAFDEIHNVTAITQDPRTGSENIWYYSTGELLGNSASLDSSSFFFGQGVWRSVDSGLTWSQIALTASNQGALDSVFDFITSIQVHPQTGDLFIAALNGIYRYDGSAIFTELETAQPFLSTGFSTDVKITSTGRVYAALYFLNDTALDGVWTLPNGVTGMANWSRIAQNGSPATWDAPGRIVLGIAPSNEDKVYALFANGGVQSPGNTNVIEADLWQWNQSTTTWIDYSSKLPDEDGATTDSQGNDPFAIQGGYDLVVSVNPTDEDFVVIGGTNIYKIGDIVNDATFTRIGGYNDNSGYALYDTAGGVAHHPDIHSLVFLNGTTMLSGTDGGVHRTTNIGDATVDWTSLNNNYQTYQFYHVAMDHDGNTNIISGGAQDNGTVFGGTNGGQPDATTMSAILSGDGGGVALTIVGGTQVNFFSSVQGGRVFRQCSSTPACTVPFAEITPSGSTSQFITYFYLDKENTEVIYYAGNSNIYRTTSASTVTPGTWSNLGSVTTGNITTYETTRGAYNAGSSFLLVGTSNGEILKLGDPQNVANSSAIQDITPASMVAGSYVSSIAMHPTNSDIGMITVASYGANNIYLSTNLTAASPTWTLVERNLTDFSVRSAAITVSGADVKYFVGTARGLYSSENPVTTDWAIEAPNDIGFAVVSALRYRRADSKLLIGTHGNGIFEGTIAAGPTAYVYNNGWTPNDPSLDATIDDSIDVVAGTATFAGNVNIGTVTISGGTMDIGMNIIAMTGNLVNNGSLEASDGLLVFNGTTTQTVSGNPFTVEAISFGNPAGMVLNTAVDLENRLALFGGVFNANGNLTFKSTYNAMTNTHTTAYLAEVPVTSSISGDVHVERYLPAQRAYRFLSSSVTTTETIFDSWQEGGLSPANFGTHITGPGDGVNGFDDNTFDAPSLFNIDTENQQYIAIANTNVTTLTAGEEYLLFVRGDRTRDLNDAATVANNTTLRTTGVLTTGDVPVTTTAVSNVAGNFGVVGNPYQAPVNMETVLAASTNLNTTFYHIYDPTIGTRGAYVTVNVTNDMNSYTDAGGSPVNNGSAANRYLQAGQAAFVNTTANGASSLTFTEASKNLEFTTDTFLTTPFEDLPLINVKLYEQTELTNNEKPRDATLITFDSQNSNELNTLDAIKQGNLDENLSSRLDNKFLSIQSRAIPTETDVISLGTLNYRATNYSFVISIQNLESHSAYLKDNALNTMTALNMGANQIDFVVSEGDESAAVDRFEIVFMDEVLSIDELFSNAFSVFPNPVVDNRFSITSELFINTETEVKLFNIRGQEVYKNLIPVQSASEITIEPTRSLASGVYILQLSQGQNQINQQLIIK